MSSFVKSMRRIAAASYLLALFIFLLAPLGSAFAANCELSTSKPLKHFGDACSAHSECLSKKCQTSNVVFNGIAQSYCTCGNIFEDDKVCSTEYGEPDDKGTWSCSDGENASHKLNFCKSSLGKICLPLKVAKTSGLDALSDPELAGAALQNEVLTGSFKPKLMIRIPQLTFMDLTGKVDEEGYLHIPWIGQYIATLYKFGMGVASIVAVAIIIKKGLDIAISGGEETAEHYKRIGQIVIGLIILWGSYTIMFYINPDLVSFRDLRVKLVSRIELPGENDGIPDGQYPTTGSVEEPSWKGDTFDCAKKESYPEKGVIPTSATISYNCLGIIGKITTVPEMKDPLCRVGIIADRAGYELRINAGGGSYRPFKQQVEGWCKDLAKNKDDWKKTKSTRAVPGYSNHGHGRAVDMFLAKKGAPSGPAGQLFGSSSTEQCRVPLEYIQKIAEFFAAADPNFVRLETEIWHFEYGTAGQSARIPAKGAGSGYPSICK
ncbi:MAG: hypothetical protein EXS55_02625 [Candidatus Magasanikbacteria bacterium]|nr:hypothetical protein [Candidatus Magasanikbacteria bacterium]